MLLYCPDTLLKYYFSEKALSKKLLHKTIFLIFQIIIGNLNTFFSLKLSMIHL
jgi:hypothetical protein